MQRRALASASVFGFLVVVSFACGDTYDEATHIEPPADAAPTDERNVSIVVAPEAGIDANTVVAPPRCDPRKPFDTVKRVPGLPNGAYCARFSADESIVTFSYDTESRTATRGPDGAYGAATTIALTDTKGNCLSASADRKVVYYEDYFSVNQQSGEPGGPYSGKLSLSNTGTKGIGHPFFDEPRGLIYADFHLVGNYFGSSAIGVARITGGTNEPFRRVDVGFGVTGGDTEQDASEAPSYKYSAATPTADGLALYFMSTRAYDGRSVADYNVWVATRASIDTDFSNPALVDSVNTANAETPTAISQDNCRLYFHSNRENPASNASATFVATRAP